MKRYAGLLIGLLLSFTAVAAQPLLTPADLQSKLTTPQVRVIDIRDAKSYAAGHIPGSVNAPYGAWRGEADNPGELPALPKLATLVQSLGLTPATHAVVVSSGADSTDFGASARVYWTLKVLGLKELSVLNGGVKAWAAANLPQNTEVPKVAASTFQPQLDNTLVATKEEVIQRVKSGNSVLIDARPPAFFSGQTRHDAAKVAGTLPGAVSLPNDKWFAPGSSAFVSPEEARRIASSSPISPDKETVSFCNTGHWAATNWFAMSEVLGQKNVKLYGGSMVDWTKDGLPMDNVPGRVNQLWQDTKKWAERAFK